MTTSHPTAGTTVTRADLEPILTTDTESREEATARLLELRTRASLSTGDPASRASRVARIEEELVRVNMTMAVSVVGRFRGRGIPSDDIQQVAYLGLVKAVRRFDASKGRAFLAYAVPTIRGEVRRYFRDQGWTVRPPRGVQDTQTQLHACEAELYQRLGRAPRPSELAEHLGVDVEQVIEALAIGPDAFAPMSLDRVADGESDSLGDRLGAPDAGFDDAETRALLEPALRGLSERDRLIIDRRFVLGRTQEEIARELGITQMQVSRLLTRLLARLRKQLGVGAA